MLLSPFRRGTTHSAVRATQRASAIGQHVMLSTSVSEPLSVQEPTVKFESIGSLRTYILNRPAKLNALDRGMITLLQPKVEEWVRSDLCHVIVGRGEGRAFCAGGDVASVVENAKDPAKISVATDFFRREFELVHLLGVLAKPYVAILDGVTMGGGVGLTSHAPFRIATEKTRFGMPETKIGYFPDVGGSLFLSRMDGEIGTYLGLTSDTLSGRAVFEHGFATHYIPSRRIPMLLDRLAELDHPHSTLIDRTIEDLSAEREPNEPAPPFVGTKRVALDYAFRHDTVEKIIADLEAMSDNEDPGIRQWALDTLKMLYVRSPTSLKVSLEAIRRGRRMTLEQALNMELKIATAFCRGASPDFLTGVEVVVIQKTKETPEWSPATLKEVTPELISRFFDSDSPYLEGVPELSLSDGQAKNPNSMKFALPTETEIGSVVMGKHASGGEMSIRIDELLARFAELRPGKMGVKEKILEVIQRRCDLIDNADGNRVWLRWKH